MSNVNITDQNSIPSLLESTFASTLEALRSDDPVSFITDLAHTYGDIVRLPFGQRDIYLLNHPDLIREIFLDKEETFFAKRENQKAQDTYLGNIAGMNPFLRNNQGKLKDIKELMADYSRIVLEAAQNTHERWQKLSQQQDPLVVDIYRQMMQTTVKIVCQVLFQGNVAVDTEKIVDALLTMDVGYGFDTIDAILEDLKNTELKDKLPPANESMTPEQEEAASYLLGVMQKLLDAYREQPQTPSLFSGLQAMIDNDKDITKTALGIFCDMHEVTVTTLSWTWYLLSQHPEVEAQLHAELANVLGERLPSGEDFKNLTYTRMILNEARRLYPTVWLVGRYVRQNVSLGAYKIPANSLVLACQRVTHRDERYFPDPDRFDPLRWTPEAVAARPERSFFPFSEGSRECAGRYFAELQDTLILATLAGRFSARLVPAQLLEPHPQKSFAPRNGIKMIVLPR